jgi:hypothetical protein
MKSEVDNYRGYEIRFDTEKETFECDIDDSRSVKKSYSSIKLFIDEYIKDNHEFKPFKIEKTPFSYYAKDGVINVIGIRKDGRFIIQNGEKKEQLSDYDLEQYMIVLLENKQFWDELKELNLKRQEIDKVEKTIKAKFKIIPVDKTKYLPPAP